jgi:bacteriocin biosynthesis cyclodehydratase domain-containing protein
VRPALKPGLLPVWRDRDTLQIGIDSRRAVALTGMAGIAWVIGLLDGSRDRAQVIRAAVDRGLPAEAAERVLALLATAGALDDFPAGTLRVLSPPLRARLAGELATVSLAHGDGDGGARTLARRLAAQIRVRGGGRIGSGIASLLAASGVGRVMRADTGDDGPEPPGRTRPDLAVLVGRQPLDLRVSLMREQIPHLAASADEAIGIVGPLVIPGRTACLRCLDLTRTDRDPAWPLILAQLAGRTPDPLACDAPLAAAVAAQAAAQALAFIDRAATAGAVTNGTLELFLPEWQWRRRTWLRHQDCACGSTTARRGE